MAIDPSIALGVRPITPIDFNEIGGRVASIRNAMAQQQHQQTADDLAQRQYQDRVDRQTQDRHRRLAQDAWLGALQVDPSERQAFLLQRTLEMGLDPDDESRAVATLSAVPMEEWDDAHVAARAQSLGGNPNAGLRTLANTDVLVNANRFGTPVTATGAGNPEVRGDLVTTPRLPAVGTRMGAPDGARPAPVAPTQGPVTYAPPVTGRISSPFGPRTAPTAGASTNHRGVDYAVPEGTPVAAAADGVVIAPVPGDRLGTSVRVRHPDGSISIYGHLSAANVRPGDQVTQGQPLGLSGRTGTASGPNLHFQVLGPDGQPVDPATVLGGAAAPAQATPPTAGLPPGTSMTPAAQERERRARAADARAEAAARARTVTPASPEQQAQGIYGFDGDGRPVAMPGGARGAAGAGGGGASREVQRATREFGEQTGAAANSNRSLDRVLSDLESGRLQLGLANNMISAGRNFIGTARPQDAAYASYRATLEQLRNDVLMLHNGVQTEGDAQRALAQLIASSNDPNVVRVQIQRIQDLNNQAIATRAEIYNRMRADSGLPPVDLETFAATIRGRPNREAPAAAPGRPPAAGPGVGARPSSRPAPARETAARAGSRANPIRVTDEASYARVPRGAYFTTPSGEVRGPKP